MTPDEKIKKAIQAIIKAGDVSKVEIIKGFVSKVYPYDDENYGMVDFVSMDQTKVIPLVSISANEENKRGRIELPSEDSEITIAVVDGGATYVLNFTHMSDVVYDVDNSIKIGATGVESVDDNTDYDEVEETGDKSITEHTPEYINSSVESESGNTQNSLNRTSEATDSVVSDASNNTSISQTSEEVVVESGGGKISQNNSGTEVESSQIKLHNGGPVEKAVLGETLSTVLKAFIDQVGNIMTTTSMGPQPILNKAAVIAMKSQVDTILSNVNLLE